MIPLRSHVRGNSRLLDSYGGTAAASRVRRTAGGPHVAAIAVNTVVKWALQNVPYCHACVPGLRVDMSYHMRLGWLFSVVGYGGLH